MDTPVSKFYMEPHVKGIPNFLGPLHGMRWINPRSRFFAFITLPSSGCSAAASPAAMGISMSRASDTFAMGAVGRSAKTTLRLVEMLVIHQGGSLKMPEVEMNQKLHV